MKGLFTFWLLSASLVFAQDNCSNLPAPATLPNNGQEPTPRMGWGGWYYQGTSLTETQVKAQADLLVSTGLKAAGYNTVEVDEWQGSRVGGVLVANANYPSGMASLFTYIHGDGLKAITYTSPYTTTCASNPGSGTFEATDASTFASWGADGLYYDGCNVASLYPSCWTASGNLVWQLMAQDIVATGRPMKMIIGTANATGDAWATNFSGWGRNAGWNEQRIASDIASPGGGAANWSRFDGYIDVAAANTANVGSGYWMSFDFLLGPSTAFTATQRQTQFGLNVLWNAPLILSMDLSTLSAGDISMYSNAAVIAVNQDSLGKMASRISQTTCGTTTCEVWKKQLSDGSFAYGLLNRDSASSHTVSTTFSSQSKVVDLWTGSTVGTSTSYSTTLQPYQLSLVKVSAADGGYSSGDVMVGFMQ